MYHLILPSWGMDETAQAAVSASSLWDRPTGRHLRYDGPTLPSGRRRKKSLAAVYVEVLIEWYSLGNDRCRRGTRVTTALVTRVQDEAEHRKKKRGCVNPSLGNALDRVVPSGRGRGALSFCQVSVRIHGLRLAEVQLTA